MQGTLGNRLLSITCIYQSCRCSISVERTKSCKRVLIIMPHGCSTTQFPDSLQPGHCSLARCSCFLKSPGRCTLDEHPRLLLLLHTKDSDVYAVYTAACTLLSWCHFVLEKCSEFKVRLLGLRLHAFPYTLFLQLAHSTIFFSKSQALKLSASLLMYYQGN